MACHRSQLKYRAPLSVASIDELVSKLDGIASGQTKVPVCGPGAKRVLFVFTGQGAQWKGVGDSLLAFPAYAQVRRSRGHPPTSLFVSC